MFGGVNGCSDSSLWLADSESSCRYQAALCERRGREREREREGGGIEGMEEGWEGREGGKEVEEGVVKGGRDRS